MAVVQYVFRVENLGPHDEVPTDVKTGIIKLIDKFILNYEPNTIKLTIDETIGGIAFKQTETVIPCLQLFVEFIEKKQPTGDIIDELSTQLQHFIDKWDDLELGLTIRIF